MVYALVSHAARSDGTALPCPHVPLLYCNTVGVHHHAHAVLPLTLPESQFFSLRESCSGSANSPCSSITRQQEQPGLGLGLRAPGSIPPAPGFPGLQIPHQDRLVGFHCITIQCRQTHFVRNTAQVWSRLSSKRTAAARGAGVQFPAFLGAAARPLILFLSSTARNPSGI